MEIVTKIAPIALALIMLGLGLGLTTQDFIRVLKQPRDFLIGFVSQLIILPIVASIYLFRNNTRNRMAQRQHNDNALNFDNEYYYRFNHNHFFSNEAYLNEDDDILYNQDHIYAEEDFDQL